jgi:beta-glucanase (GH16 family)
VPTRSALPQRMRYLIRAAAAVVLLGGVLVPASAVGAASTSCDVLQALISGCQSAVTTGGGPAPTCGTEAPVKADGSAWECTFDDEFGGTALDRSSWTVQTTADSGFHSGRECMVDDPNNLAVTDGRLDLTVRDVGAPFVCHGPRVSYSTQYTGASVYTATFDQEYGRFEVRAKFPESYGVSGIQSSLWLFPRQVSVSSVLSGATEIDIAEAYSRHPNIVVPTVHGLSVSSLLPTSYCTVPDWGADFHTYAVEWTPSTITFIYDGTACMQVATPPSANLGTPNPFLVALTQAMGIGTNSNSSAPPVPGTEQIDYVRVWK